jgi:hypothetical protein
MDPTWVKALYLEDDNHNAVMLVTMDAIGSDGPLVDLAHTYAVTLGLPLEREQVIFGASHTHSGPGGVSPSFLWVWASSSRLPLHLFSNLPGPRCRVLSM